MLIFHMRSAGRRENSAIVHADRLLNETGSSLHCKQQLQPYSKVSRSDQAHPPHEGHAQMRVMNSLTKVQLEVFGLKGAGLAVPGKLARR